MHQSLRLHQKLSHGTIIAKFFYSMPPDPLDILRTYYTPTPPSSIPGFICMYAQHMTSNDKNWWESHFKFVILLYLIFSLVSCAQLLFFAWKGAFVHACPSPACMSKSQTRHVWGGVNYNVSLTLCYLREVQMNGVFLYWGLCRIVQSIAPNYFVLL